jgi:hypothetical protein
MRTAKCKAKYAIYVKLNMPYERQTLLFLLPGTAHYTILILCILGIKRLTRVNCMA